jgi:hypothetical protein
MPQAQRDREQAADRREDKSPRHLGSIHVQASLILFGSQPRMRPAAITFKEGVLGGHA